MKILLTNNALNHYYGTETWTYAMAKELSKHHDIEVFTLNDGKLAGKIREFAPVYTEMRDADLYIVNHTNCLDRVPDNKPVIFTSHGRCDIELAPENVFSVGVTEETAKGKPVIRNGIDCERFSPKNPINEKLKTVLYLSHPHYSKGKEIVGEACNLVGCDLITIDEEIFEIEELISKADLVITLGRGILESLACGRNVISADWRDGWMNSLSGAGMIIESNFDELKTHAFSGRNGRMIEFTPKLLAEEMIKYSQKNNLRDRILKEFNIEKQWKLYLTYFNKGMLYTKNGKSIG